jgi:hypothetical protein
VSKAVVENSEDIIEDKTPPEGDSAADLDRALEELHAVIGTLKFCASVVTVK